jgi:putative transposase
VWAADVPSLARPAAWAYLVAILEWFSRFVLAWELRVTRDSDLCVRAWNEAVARAGRAPDFMPTDRGVEFCRDAWLDAVQRQGARISQDGRGQALGHGMVERRWRTVKHEHGYRHDYQTVSGRRQGLQGFFSFYHERRWLRGPRIAQGCCEDGDSWNSSFRRSATGPSVS